MVLNVGELRGGDHDAVSRDIRAVVEAAHQGGAIVKVILETALLTDEQKITACGLAKDAGAEFVKTSTGFGPGGATVEDVALMRRAVGTAMGVKASGGIRTLADFQKNDYSGRVAGRLQQQREDHGGDRGLTMTMPRKSAIRFRERAELLDFLLEVSRATSETLDLDKLLANVAAVVKDVIPYDLFAILLYSEKAQGLRIRYSIGHRSEVVRSLVIPLGEGVVGAAAESREPVLVDDVRSDPRYLNALDAVRSELAVPMMARGKLVGILDVQSTRVGAYSDQDLSLLRLIAARVASSIDNANLYRRVDRQNRTLRTLARLSQEFGSILDLDELLGKIAESVREPDQLRRLQRAPGRHGKKGSAPPLQRGTLRSACVSLDNIPMGKGITGAAAEGREAIRVVNTLNDPRYIASHPDVHSELAVPLVVQDRVVGSCWDVVKARG